MSQTDIDIETLGRLLGHARPAYQGLRHTHPLRAAPAHAPARQHRLSPRMLAASFLLAVAALGLALQEMSPTRPSQTQRISRLTIPDASPPLTLRPMGRAKSHLSMSRALKAARTGLPARPKRSRG